MILLKGNMIFKRISAFLIDFLVVSFVSMAIANVSFINPNFEKYKIVSEDYTEIVNKYYAKEIDMNEFNVQVKEISYDMNKNGYVYLISDVVIAFLYYGVFAFWTKGQTLGKKLMNIKIVSNKEDKELKLYNYFIRTFILNGVILNIIVFIAIWFNKNTYFEIYNVATNVDTMLMIVIFLSVMFSATGRGLHDMLSGTKVVDLAIPKEERSTSEFIKEDKDDKEEKKENEEIEVIKPVKKSNTSKSKKKNTKKD